MTATIRAVFTLLVLVPIACFAQVAFDRTVRSSNVEELSDLRALMTKHGIRYRNTDLERGMEGFSYGSVDESRMASLRKKLDRQTLVKHKEPEAREYMQKLLTEMNHDFIVSSKSDGIWIKWFPESKEQSDEVSMKVVKHMFDLQAARANQDCGPSSAPSNSTLVADARQERPRAAQCGR